MNPILFLSLMIVLAGALPWWPYSAYGRLRHHRPWDWLLDNPSWEDFRTMAAQTSADTPIELATRRKHREKRVIKAHDDRSETHLVRGEIRGPQGNAMQLEALQRQFDERWVAEAT